MSATTIKMTLNMSDTMIQIAEPIFVSLFQTYFLHSSETAPLNSIVYDLLFPVEASFRINTCSYLRDQTIFIFLSA